MTKIYRVIQIKLNQFKKMSIWSPTYLQSVLKRCHSDKHLRVVTYKMAVKISCHRYGRKLRHFYPMYTGYGETHDWLTSVQNSFYLESLHQCNVISSCLVLTVSRILWNWPVTFLQFNLLLASRLSQKVTGEYHRILTSAHKRGNRCYS